MITKLSFQPVGYYRVKIFQLNHNPIRLSCQFVPWDFYIGNFEFSGWHFDLQLLSKQLVKLKVDLSRFTFGENRVYSILRLVLSSSGLRIL